MKLPESWFTVDGETASALEAELARELPPSHQLCGRRLVAIAKRERRDDVLFRLPNGKIYWVHLTRTVETDPRWPSTESYENMEDFLERWPREELGDYGLNDD